MSFSFTLRQLKIELKFFKYYRKFVFHYAAITKLLMKFNTREFKNSFFKKQSRRKHAENIKIKDNSDISAIKVIKLN